MNTASFPLSSSPYGRLLPPSCITIVFLAVALINIFVLSLHMTVATAISAGILLMFREFKHIYYYVCSRVYRGVHMKVRGQLV